MYALIVNIGKQSVDSNGIIALFYGILPVYGKYVPFLQDFKKDNVFLVCMMIAQ